MFTYEETDQILNVLKVFGASECFADVLTHITKVIEANITDRLFIFPLPKNLTLSLMLYHHENLYFTLQKSFQLENLTLHPKRGRMMPNPMIIRDFDKTEKMECLKINYQKPKK